jgi:outer membrane murein-binding lipoprotein Lpp
MSSVIGSGSFFGSLLVVVGLTGCVSQGKYDALQAQNSQLQQQNSSLSQEC